MGIRATLDLLSFNAAALAAAEAKGEDLNGMLNSAKSAADELVGSCKTIASLIPSINPNFSAINGIAAINSAGGVLNFADPYQSGMTALTI